MWGNESRPIEQPRRQVSNEECVIKRKVSKGGGERLSISTSCTPAQIKALLASGNFEVEDEE